MYVMIVNIYAYTIVYTVHIYYFFILVHKNQQIKKTFSIYYVKKNIKYQIPVVSVQLFICLRNYNLDEYLLNSESKIS